MENEIREIKDAIRLKIVETRKAKGLTQKKVAELAGVPTATYADAERGEREFTLDRLLRVCKVLEIDNPFKQESSGIKIAADEETVLEIRQMLLQVLSNQKKQSNDIEFLAKFIQSFEVDKQLGEEKD